MIIIVFKYIVISFTTLWPGATPIHMSDGWWGEGLRQTVIDFRVYGIHLNMGYYVAQQSVPGRSIMVQRTTLFHVAKETGVVVFEYSLVQTDIFLIFFSYVIHDIHIYRTSGVTFIIIYNYKYKYKC